MSDEYTPTTEVVRDEWGHLEGFIIPDGVPKREAAFDRWLAAHDREVAAKALRGWADFQERSLEQFAYVTDDCDRSETAEWCKAIRHYADRIETEPSR